MPDWPGTWAGSWPERTPTAYADRARRSRETLRDLARFALMLGLLPAVLASLPFATAAVYLHEQLFARQLHRRYRQALSPFSGRPTASGPLGPSAAASPVS